MKKTRVQECFEDTSRWDMIKTGADQTTRISESMHDIVKVHEIIQETDVINHHSKWLSLDCAYVHMELISDLIETMELLMPCNESNTAKFTRLKDNITESQKLLEELKESI